MNKEKEKESKRMEKEMKKVELLTFMQKVPELAKNTRDWPTIQLLIKRSKVWIVEMQSRPAEAPKPPPAVRRQTIAGDGGEGGLPAAPKLPSLQKLNLAIQFASLGRTTIPDSILRAWPRLSKFNHSLDLQYVSQCSTSACQRELLTQPMVLCLTVARRCSSKLHCSHRLRPKTRRQATKSGCNLRSVPRPPPPNKRQ